MKLSEVAQKLGCRLEGSGEPEIVGVAGIEQAQAGEITFLANRRYFPLLKTTRASAVLLQAGIAIQRAPGAPEISALRSENPYMDFARAIELFYQSPRARDSRDGSDCKKRSHRRWRAYRTVLFCG